MPERTLNVLMDGVPVGRLGMSDSGALSFTYDAAYAANPDSTPLSLSMPLHQLSHNNRTVNPFLQGLLPDNPLALQSMSNGQSRIGAYPPHISSSHSSPTPERSRNQTSWNCSARTSLWALGYPLHTPRYGIRRTAPYALSSPNVMTAEYRRAA